MALFRKLNTISDDTMVSQYLSDMYDGGTTTANLIGGMTKNKYLFQATIPPKPTYGDAELSRLDFDFYVDSITVGQNTTKYPSVATYLVKEGISITEGYQSHLDSDILCFSSVMDGFSSMSDIMDGSGVSGGDGAIYKNIARTIYRDPVNFAYVIDMKKYGQKGWKWHHTEDDRSKETLKKDFGRPASDFGQVDTEGIGNNYVQVGTETKYPFWGGQTYGWKQCLPNEAHSGIGYEVWLYGGHIQMNQNADMASTDGYGNEATPANTIFEFIRGSAEYSNWDDDAKSQDLLGVGIPRFNTSNFLTGAQSLELFTFWTGDSTNKFKVKYSGRPNGPNDRQECVLVKKNIPYPNKKPVLPSKERDKKTIVVAADISENNFILEGHGLEVDSVVYFDDENFGNEDRNVWSNGFGGSVTVSGTTIDMEERNAYGGHYVRSVTTDTFRLSASSAGTGDAFRYTLSSTNSFDRLAIPLRIPDPTNEIKGSSEATRSGAVFDDYDYNEHASIIEMDINIKKLAKAFSWKWDEGEIYDDDPTSYTSQDSGGQHLLTLRRGLHVVYGTSPPEQNETLYDYIERLSFGTDNARGPTGDTCPHRIEGPGLDGMTGTGDGQTIWPIRGAMHHDNKTKQNDCFGGYSVLNTEFGLQVIPFNGVIGSNASLSSAPSMGLYIADYNLQKDSSGGASEAKGDLFLRQDKLSGSALDDIGATGANIQVPIEDQWVKFTMAVDPSTSMHHVDGTGTTGMRSTFSLGRLFISDTSGEMVTLGSTSTSGRKFLDIALLGDKQAYYSYNENKGKVNGGSFVVGEKYKATDIDDDDWSAWGGTATHEVGEIFIATAAGSGTGNKATSLSQDPSNWPKHMSIWLTNYKSEYSTTKQADTLLAIGTDAESKVLIDCIKFKDFNFEITNSSQLDNQTITNPIKIESGRGFQVPYGLWPAFDSRETRFGANTESIDAYYSRTPSILTIGVKNRNYLSYLATSSGGETMPWTEFPYGWWLNDFSASNLAAVGTIPDDHIKGTVSMAHYNDKGSSPENSIPLGKQFSQIGIDHQEYYESGNAGTLLPHNGYLAYDDDPGSAAAAFSTSWLNTGFTLSTNDVSAKQFVCGQKSQATFASAGIPIRTGDKVRLVETNAYRGGNPANTVEYTVATVTGAINGSVGADSSITFTVEETVAGSDNDLTGYMVLIQTPGLCRNFSQKGGFQIYYNSYDEHTAVRRENIAASARIMEIGESTTSGTLISVDQMSPFDCAEDEEYVAYMYGEPVTFSDRADGEPDMIAADSANAATGIKILAKDVDAKTITLDWDGKDNAGENMLSYDNVHRLFISPWRYWALIMINLADADGKELSSRQYGNIQLLNNDWTDKNSARRSWLGEGLHNTSSNDFVDTAYSNRTGLGTTWNEFMFNDTTTAGVNGAYLNSWELDRMPDHSQLECDTDFGFGKYDDKEDKGGNTGVQVVVDSQYNRIEMPGVVKGGDLEPNDNVGFLLDYQDVGLAHKTTFRTSGHATYPPYLYAVYQDEKPANPTLSVKPHDADPFLPEFTWEASDSDLWYGILHVDSKSIDSQYHNAIFHMPMNESGVHGATITLTGNDLYSNDTTYGSINKTALFTYSEATVDAEGLAGNCVRFDGNNDVITYTPDTSSSEDRAFPELSTAVASGGTGQASIVVHITPDNGISGSTNNIFKGMPFHLYYNATSDKIVANFYTAASNYVQLTSPGIVTDGQTPTCVIATIDNSLKSGNCKLYINGALVDQSGQLSSSAPGAGGNSWHNNSGTPVVPWTHTDAVTIGRASNSFDGRIEELVIYKSCIYPIVPSQGNFVLDKPLKEIQNGTPISNNVRLFVKDYHNIRGSTTEEVAASAPVSFRKAAFRLVD